MIDWPSLIKFWFISSYVLGKFFILHGTETLSVHENKRKSDNNIQPSKKRQRLSSAVNYCPMDNSAAVTSIVIEDVVQHREQKPSKRSRLYLKRRRKQRNVNFQKVDYDAPCITSCTNGKASTGNRPEKRNLDIGVNRSLSEFSKQVIFVKTIRPIKLSLKMHKCNHNLIFKNDQEMSINCS